MQSAGASGLLHFGVNLRRAQRLFSLFVKRVPFERKEAKPMEVFDEYLAQIENPQHRARLEEILQLVRRTFPRLEPRFAWNQPMFTDHGTFIIAFSVAAHHIAFALEAAGLQQFLTEIDQAGYSHGAKFIRIRWEQPVDYALLQRMIEFNIQEKSDCKTFWRK